MTAVLIAGIAAYFSIEGLATIFAAAHTPVVIMASSLELGKLCCVSFLHRYWAKIHILLKSYMIAAVLVLSFITSLGIFGLLSSSHVNQSAKSESSNLRLTYISEKLETEKGRIDKLESILGQLDAAVQIYIDKQYVSKGLKERKEQKGERDSINIEIKEISDRVRILSDEKLDLQAEVNKSQAEFGPLPFIAKALYGEAEDAVDKAVKILIVLLVIVFDPLAIVLIICGQYVSDENMREKQEATEKRKKSRIKKPVVEELEISQMPPPIKKKRVRKPKVEIKSVPLSENPTYVKVVSEITEEMVEEQREAINTHQDNPAVNAIRAELNKRNGVEFTGDSPLHEHQIETSNNPKNN